MRGYERGLAMKQVRLGTNPQYSAVHKPCGRLLLFERDRLHPHDMQACQQKCRAELLAVDLAVDPLGRLFNPQLLKQPGVQGQGRGIGRTSRPMGVVEMLDLAPGI